jgi:hypothetical protein
LLVRKIYGFHKASVTIAQSSMEEDTGCSESSIKRAVAKLEKKGLIAVERGSDGHGLRAINIYSIRENHVCGERQPLDAGDQGTPLSDGQATRTPSHVSEVTPGTRNDPNQASAVAPGDQVSKALGIPVNGEIGEKRDGASRCQGRPHLKEASKEACKASSPAAAACTSDLSEGQVQVVRELVRRKVTPASASKLVRKFDIETIARNLTLLDGRDKDYGPGAYCQAISEDWAQGQAESKVAAASPGGRTTTDSENESPLARDTSGRGYTDPEVKRFLQTWWRRAKTVLRALGDQGAQKPVVDLWCEVHRMASVQKKLFTFEEAMRWDPKLAARVAQLGRLDDVCPAFMTNDEARAVEGEWLSIKRRLQKLGGQHYQDLLGFSMCIDGARRTFDEEGWFPSVSQRATGSRDLQKYLALLEPGASA